MVIKTTDNLPSTELQDFPFEIPESWVWVRLGDIGNWGAGATPNRHESKYYEKGTIPWLKTGDLNDGIINNIPEYITELALEKTSVKLNPIGTVLIAMYGATIGKLGILNIEATTNQACCACIPYTGIYNKYLFYYLMSQKSEFQSRSEGSGQPNISKEKIIEYIFPLPPLNEQKRIVAKIEELLPYIEQYAEKEEKLTALHQQFPEQLKKSILQAATQGKLTKQDPNDEPALVLIERIKAEKLRLIAEKKLKKPKVVSEIVLRDNLPYEIINGEERCIADEVPFEIPESWCWVRLGEIGNWGAGATPNRHEPKYYENGTIPWLKTGDLNDGIITEIPEYITELAIEKTSVKLNPVGSVLIAMYGATIGKLGILNIEATTNQACCACIPYTGIYNKYLFYYLMSQKTELQKRSEGSGQPNISKEKIINYLFPLPPFNEQKRIVEKIETLFSTLQNLSKN
ncbi:restriction endonuclease subunit S [Actinobacillus pleuropneumoniae]|uniref:Restriction endonuclease subunit S n=3 Tax=Actinobacillus pleuropneumoniae TaxID=715 RepID=A0A9Q4H727_ACTPL|nr:restriction endonuclease subunit S [Actinobacillus pleuropneumoniae]MCY6524144.1 restriction endonuclease subunit S [Actinobacillus pleuropneumoniae]